MQKSSYEFYVDRQNKISNFSLIKSILINLGFVFLAVTLIVVGISLIADSKDNFIKLALPICVLSTFACFLSIVPVNNKLRELRFKKRYREKNELVNN